MKDSVYKYFKEHPENRDGVMKAFHAYHSTPSDKGAHVFTSAKRSSKCIACKRTREQVRWDNLPSECSERNSKLDKGSEEIIKGEEESYFKLLAKAEKFIPSFIEKRVLTAQTLFKLRTERGYDEDTLEAFVPNGHLNPLWQEFKALLEEHSQKSKRAFIPEIIKAK